MVVAVVMVVVLAVVLVVGVVMTMVVWWHDGWLLVGERWCLAGGE